MIVAVVGSRDFGPYWEVVTFIDRLAVKYPDAVVVSGGANGVDFVAEKQARAKGLDVISYRPIEYENMNHQPEYTIDTHTTGDHAQQIVVVKSRRINPPYFRTYARAAHHRNGWIVEDAEQVVTFWDGQSTGTADTIRKAERAGKPLHRMAA